MNLLNLLTLVYPVLHLCLFIFIFTNLHTMTLDFNSVLLIVLFKKSLNTNQEKQML